MKYFTRIALLSAVLLLGAEAVYASSYEWISNLFISPISIVHPGDRMKVYRDINTSGSYLEYRSAYYQITTSTSPFEGAWNEWTECRASSTVSGTVNDRCFPNAPTGLPVTSTLWIRVSTNYSGCGTYTPTPDILNCGDATTTSVTLTP